MRSLRSAITRRSHRKKEATSNDGFLPESLVARQEDLQQLLTELNDWQLTHGSLLKIFKRGSSASEEDRSFTARPVGVSLYPLPFPRDLFREAKELQFTFNELYSAVANDEGFLYECVKDLLPVDRLAAKLWEIHAAVSKEGYAQDLSLGLFRSDYMLQEGQSSGANDAKVSLKQVEFNTFSVAGGVHANKIAQCHRHLSMNGTYELCPPPAKRSIDLKQLPSNDTIKFLADGLAKAHHAYGPARSENARSTAVLFVVAPNNFNICDERPVEYCLWEGETPIAAYRVDFGGDVLSHTFLGENRELLFQPRQSRGSSYSHIEISCVYLRAGLDEDEYDNIGMACRLRLERSCAIKCPSVLGHIAGFKKVQQELARSGALSRFLPSGNDVERVSRTFMTMYPLDESEMGLKGRSLAQDPKTASDFVLKPSLEGGGHNVHGEDIPTFLKDCPKAKWTSFILMEKIRTPTMECMLKTPKGIYFGPVITELGVFGMCLSRRCSASDEKDETIPVYRLVDNLAGGWSLKTKPSFINEMSVVKGFGCFDSLQLVDDLRNG
ncbi:MAG: hypothetical protein M1831_005686 [Alyxoria varia]|nr:MAG: hypothetical protein M1831_005686 [Alyxoria varia]